MRLATIEKFSGPISPLAMSSALMVISALCLSLGVVFAKQLSDVIVLPHLVELRFLMPAVLLWFMALFVGFPKIAKGYLRYYVLRAVFVVLGQYALFYYIQDHSIKTPDLILRHDRKEVFFCLSQRFLTVAPQNQAREIKSHKEKRIA